ncbi:MAG: hypothetical protein HDQ87_11830, partial [Clostridia bacterium]|nr:hypothetical protein [Clostridia bacterium]
CQPTPAAEAVVNQRDNVPESAMIGESATVDPQATTAPAAKYAAAERWHETIDKAENFRVIADVDVMMPDVTAYPVEKVAPRELTQELADQLIEYFVPGAEFYEMDQATTKAEWEEQILAMQEALAADEARGDQDAAAQDRAAIEELTAFYENAPDQAERRAATTEFGYIRDYSGEIMEEDGPNFINVCADGPDGTVRMIAARRGHPEDLSQFPYFMYTAASYITEQQAAANQEALGTERESAEQLEEPARSEELERLDRFEEIGNQQLPLLAANSIDLEEARRRGSELLENLGIRGVQISAADKALWAPEQRGMDAGLAGTDVLTGAQTNLKQPGAYLEFQRENGGIPCVSQQSQNGIPNRGRREYSAPFIPERGCILFDADWNVQIFSWESPTEAVEIVAPDSRLIPVTEAEQKLVEELYRNELAVSEEYLKQMGLTYDVTELRLVMGYIDAAGEPDKALAVPAWYMRAEGTPRHGGSGGIYNVQEVMVSALDGAPILMPGTAQSYNYDPEAQS